MLPSMSLDPSTQLTRLEREDLELERRLDLLRFQVEEIAAARLSPGGC